MYIYIYIYIKGHVQAVHVLMVEHAQMTITQEITHVNVLKDILARTVQMVRLRIEDKLRPFIIKITSFAFLG